MADHLTVPRRRDARQDPHRHGPARLARRIATGAWRRGGGPRPKWRRRRRRFFAGAGRCRGVAGPSRRRPRLARLLRAVRQRRVVCRAGRTRRARAGRRGRARNRNPGREEEAPCLRKKAAGLRAAAARAAAGSPSPRAATGSSSLHRTRAALGLEAPARQDRSRSSAEVEAVWPALRRARSLDAQCRGSVSPASSNGLEAEPLWTATEEEAPPPPTRPSESPLQERLRRPARPSGTPPSSVATRSSSSCAIFCGPG